MATDATGTPSTNYSIPKLNTAADPPSGKGLNAIVDFIDSLLKTGFVTKPASLASGEVPVWNGTDFVRSTTTKVGTGSLSGYPWSNADISASAAIVASKLAGYPSDGTKVLKGDGNWGTINTTISVGTALPGSPSDGDEYILVDSTTTPTYAWHFRYSSGISDSYKWVFIGGASASGEVATPEDTASGTYVALSTAGPSITLPKAGIYEVRHGCEINNQAFVTDGAALMSYDIGGTGAVDADAAMHTASLGASGVHDLKGSTSRSKRQTFASAVTLTAKYRAEAGNTIRFRNRWLKVTPVRVG